MNATPEEWRTAYEGYRDEAKRHGVEKIPSQDDMMATPLGRATLQCRIMAMRSTRARHQAAALVRVKVPARRVLDGKMRAAGERDDD